MTDDKFIFPPLYQLGYVVGDIEKACRHFETNFAMGPFSPPMEVDMTGAVLRGKTVETKIKVSFAQLGDVQIEFIQPVEGENPYFEYLAAYGDVVRTLHHSQPSARAPGQGSHGRPAISPQG